MNRPQAGLPPLPGAVLVLGELHDVPCDLAQLQVGVAVVAEVLEQAAASRGHDVGHAIAEPRGREELAAGAEQAGAAASAAVLRLRPRRRRDVAPAPIGQTTYRKSDKTQGS